MTWIEIIAVIFSLLCVVLATQRNILNWPVGIIGASCYLVLFYQEKLYADMLLQIFFVVQGVYGWYEWHVGKNRDQEIIILSLSAVRRVWLLAFLLLIIIVWGSGLNFYTDASIPYLDAAAASFSLFANLLMARRYVENWLLWIAADVCYICIFLYKELYLSCGIYVLFLLMCLAGFWTWIRKRNTK